MIRPTAERASVIAPLAVFVEELLVQENQPIQAQQDLFACQLFSQTDLEKVAAQRKYAEVGLPAKKA